MHAIKKEHFYLGRGSIVIYYHDNADELKEILKNDTSLDKRKVYGAMERVTLRQGQVFYVPTGRVHQMKAREDSDLFEFSTQDFPEDSYRILKGD